MKGQPTTGKLEETAKTPPHLRFKLAPDGGILGWSVRPGLKIEQIVAWAKAHREATGRWPSHASGPLIGVAGESWSAINAALRTGSRGLPRGKTLARVLAEHRDPKEPQWIVPSTNGQALGPSWRYAPKPSLTIRRILAYVDAFYRQTSRWPQADSTCREGLPVGTSWRMIDRALRRGHHGLRGGSSLARVLQGRRGVRNSCHLPRLSIDKILAWADAHFVRTGEWPTIKSGLVPQAPAPGETWRIIAMALYRGQRGLPAGTTLTKVLAEHRGVHAPLTFERILAWADAHRAATGSWPLIESGPIPGAYKESWRNIAESLSHGHRGLPGGWTLPRLLAQYRGNPLYRRAKKWAHLITAS